MPPAIEGRAGVPGGVSEACLMNDHSVCTNPRCACSCHRPEVNPNTPTPTPAIAGPEKACPKCGSRRPFNETYCRVDGERLASLLCGVCGSGMNMEDSYCFNCGGPKGSVKPITTKPNLTVPDLDNLEQDVLKGLQEELGEQKPVEMVQRVIEQPAGSNSSFKLVSSPNPNKLRQPAGSQPVRGGKLPSKLPIKPV